MHYEYAVASLLEGGNVVDQYRTRYLVRYVVSDTKSKESSFGYHALGFLQLASFALCLPAAGKVDRLDSIVK